MTTEPAFSREATETRNPCTTIKSSPHLQQLDKDHAKQQGPSTVQQEKTLRLKSANNLNPH